MDTKINRRGNIVLTVEQPDESVVYIHSTLITREMYDQHFKILAAAVSQMYGLSMAPGTCARIAMQMIREIAREWDGENEKKPKLTAVDKLLLPEIWRMTMAIIPKTVSGRITYESVPFQEVIDRGDVLDEDDVNEVQNFLCFFTAASWVHHRSELTKILHPQWTEAGARIGSWNSTEFANSLPTSTPAENTGAKATPSFMPS